MTVSDSRTPRKGRGALANSAGRFERTRRELFDDGWWLDSPPSAPQTSVAEEACRTVISRNASPDVPFDRSINPYRGCEHGCIYCFARPTHAYIGLSSGLDFETRLIAKRNAPEVLARELGQPGYRPRPIMLGANTDPYQPLERTRRITRGILEVLAAAAHPVMITTKSALVLRDLDLLAPMAARRLVHVALSVTTLASDLARVMEPRAATPARRLAAVRSLADAGIPVAVLAAPLIPFINDHELEAIVAAAAAAGAASARYVLLRLPHEVEPLFCEWLRAHFPNRAERVLSQLRACHGGKLYDSAWQHRMSGSGPYAALLARRCAVAVRRSGLNQTLPAIAELDTTQFRPPHQAVPCPQMDLFSAAGAAGLKDC